MSGGRGGRKLGRGNGWLVLGLDQMPFCTWDSNDNVLLTQKLNSRKWYFQEKLGVTSPLLDGVMLLFSPQSCLTLCNVMDCSTPGFPLLHYLPEFAQTHVHWVGDAIQPSHPLSSPSPPVLNLSHHQGLFQWIGSSHQVAQVLLDGVMPIIIIQIIL